jgi:hypothetical protein
MANVKFVDLPEAFYSHETGERFEQCLICERSLTRGGLYLVEKAYRNGETLYDYAMCSRCHEELIESLSPQSRRTVDSFFERHVDFQLREIEMNAIAPDRYEPRVAECLITRKPIVPGDEYQVFAACFGEYLVLNFAPYAITSAPLEELYESLSAQTREELDGFTRDYLRIPPEMLRRPRNTPVLV